MFLLACLLCAREITLLPDGKLHVYFLGVGQGDSTLIVTPSGSQIIIDGGPNQNLLEYLGKHLPFFDRTIELLVITHPDADHITAIPEVLERYDVSHIMLNGAIHSSGKYAQLLNSIAQNHIDVLLPTPSKDIVIDGVLFDCIWPEREIIGTMQSSQNAQSIVLRMFYKEHSVLFSGDLTRESENRILSKGTPVSADIMSVPHHGSHTSSSTGFLLSISPQLGIVSSGKNNRYGHPHNDVLDRYAFLGIPIKNTANVGSISLEFD